MLNDNLECKFVYFVRVILDVCLYFAHICS